MALRHLTGLLRDISARRDWGGVALLSLASAVSLLLLAVPFSALGTELEMARFHRRGSFAEWAVFQPIPAMYNFRNRVWFYPGVRPPDLPVDPNARQPDGSPGFRYVNHHAYRAVINPIEAPLPNRGCLTGVLISDYRDRWLRTEYRVCRESDTRFTVERNDPDAP